MVAAYTLTGKTVNQRKDTLASLEQQATSAEAQANSLASYSAFSDLRKKRAETVTSIARSRFDWAHVMHEIARVIRPTPISRACPAASRRRRRRPAPRARQ